MLVYDRKTRSVIEEQEYGEAALRFLYDTIPGRVLLKLVAYKINKDLRLHHPCAFGQRGKN